MTMMIQSSAAKCVAISFAVAGSAFAFIAVVVMVRGIADLRQMFAGLRAERRD